MPLMRVGYDKDHRLYFTDDLSTKNLGEVYAAFDERVFAFLKKIRGNLELLKELKLDYEKMQEILQHAYNTGIGKDTAVIFGLMKNCGKSERNNA